MARLESALPRFKEFPSLLVYEYRVRAMRFDQGIDGGTFAPGWGVTLQLDRRTFVKNSLSLPGGALLANCDLLPGSPLSQKNISRHRSHALK